jgi:hypothetical protein
MNSTDDNYATGVTSGQRGRMHAQISLYRSQLIPSTTRMKVQK